MLQKNRRKLCFQHVGECTIYTKLHLWLVTIFLYIYIYIYDGRLLYMKQTRNAKQNWNICFEIFICSYLKISGSIFHLRRPLWSCWYYSMKKCCSPYSSAAVNAIKSDILRFPYRSDIVPIKELMKNWNSP